MSVVVARRAPYLYAQPAPPLCPFPLEAIQRQLTLQGMQVLGRWPLARGSPKRMSMETRITTTKKPESPSGRIQMVEHLLSFPWTVPLLGLGRPPEAQWPLPTKVTPPPLRLGCCQVFVLCFSLLLWGDAPLFLLIPLCLTTPSLSSSHPPFAFLLRVFVTGVSNVTPLSFSPTFLFLGCFPHQVTGKHN